MSYEPTVWKDGDLVTSAKLNKMEQGIASGGGLLIVHDLGDNLDKTWQEIHDADFAVLSEMPREGLKQWAPCEMVYEAEGFVVVFTNWQITVSYIAETKDGYPVYTETPPYPESDQK